MPLFHYPAIPPSSNPTNQPSPYPITLSSEWTLLMGVELTFLIVDLVILSFLIYYSQQQNNDNGSWYTDTETDQHVSFRFLHPLIRLNVYQAWGL